MINYIIGFSIKNKIIVGLGVLILIGLGLYSFTRLPIDAVPDITNNQVQVVTVSPSLASQEIEQLITQPVERNLSNLQGVTEIRSISRYGLSVITVVFEDKIPTLKARQLVSEKLQGINNEIPRELGTPEMMPITTGLGEIYQYVLQVKAGYEGQYNLMELRSIQDWVVKKQLAGLDGVVEVSSFGGYLKQYEIALNPSKLVSMDIDLKEIIEALKNNNQNIGGSYMEKGPDALYIRSSGMIQSLDDIAMIHVKNVNGIPVKIGDVADSVHFGYAKRFGAITKDGKGEVVGGITLMLKGANSSQTVENVKQRMNEIRKSLPEGIEIVPYLDRSILVEKAIHTVSKNLIEGGLIVIFVLVLMLGNLRAGLIVASVIPLSMLFALSMMNIFGISANLMSLGALDFGLIVDGAVVIVEGIIHQLHKKFPGARLKQNEMDNTVKKFSSGIMSSAAFGQIIILIVYLPILALVGVEGKMFKPMALTVSFAIIGALILSLTYVPMVSSLFLSKKIQTKLSISDKIMIKIEKLYEPVIRFAIRKKVIIISFALILLTGSILLFTRLGSVFIPTLEEGDLAMQMTMKPGTSLQEVIKTTTKVENILINNFPEVISVVSKIGTAEVPTDPMGMEDADIMILLKKKSEWTSAKNREELVEKMKDKLNELPGVSFEFSQPIQLRFNELMTGSKADLAIKIFGENLDTLFAKANEAEKIISGIQGASDIKVEQTTGLPQLIINYKRDKLAYYGLSIADVNEAIQCGFAGLAVGEVYENERKYELALRYIKNAREDVTVFDRMYVRSANETMVPISQVADIQYKDGYMLISRDNTQRRVVIGVNVRNRDIQSLVDEIKLKLDKSLKLPEGYHIKYGGEFEKLEHARKRLSIAVPVALALIFMLLYFAFNSFRQALMIYSAIPMSAIGGIVALWLRGMPFSISAGVGFIALFGVAVLNGIVLIGYFNQLEKEGYNNLIHRILLGTKVRLRPVLMTAAVASLGFIPMAFSTSAGGEVQQPLATVVIGGLISSTLLTLLVLPIIYLMFSKRKEITKTGIVSVVILFFLINKISAQQSEFKKLPLEKMIEIGLQNNLKIQNTRLETEKNKKLVKSSWDVGLTHGNLQRGQINSGLIDNYWSIQQDLGNPIQSIFKVGYLKQEVKVSKQITLHEEGLLKMNISLAYNHTIYLNSKLNIAKDILLKTIDYQKVMNLRYETGESNILEKINLENQLALFKNKVMLLESEYLNSLRNIQQLLNSDTIYYPKDDTLKVLKWEKDSCLNHPALTVLDEQIISSSKNINTKKAGFAPTLNAGYFNQQLDNVSNFQGYQLGIGIPLWFLNKQSEIQVSKISLIQKQNERDYTELELNNELKTLIDQLNIYSKQISFFQSAILPNAREELNKTRKMYEEGEIGYIEYWKHFENSYQIVSEYLDMVAKYNDLTYIHAFYTNKQ